MADTYTDRLRQHYQREDPPLRTIQPEWRVMRVTNVSTHEAHEVGRVRAATDELARVAACEQDIIGDFQTFRVEPVA